MNFKEGDIVEVDLRQATGFTVESSVGEVINVGARTGMIILALGTNQQDVRPLFIVHPSKLKKV